MKSENRNIGQIGEQLAAVYLENLGYKIIERNFQTRFGEIDLICKDEEVWVFVEVKAKKTLMFGTPEDMFTKGKYQKVKRMAMVYLKGKEVRCRIDMVAIELDNNHLVNNLRHFVNVIF